jgi:hypothetical protein
LQKDPVGLALHIRRGIQRKRALDLVETHREPEGITGERARKEKKRPWPQTPQSGRDGNSHFDLWEGEAPAEPTSNLAISFDSPEVPGFGGSLTLPETDGVKSK